MIQDVAFSRCIECNNLALIVDYRAGEIVCTNCGEVNQSRIVDERDEFIQYQDDDRPRSGGTRSSGMAETAIGYYYTTFDVNTGTENQRKLLTRLQYEMTDKTEINLVNNLDIVREICGQLHVPQDIKVSSFSCCKICF